MLFDLNLTSGASLSSLCASDFELLWKENILPRAASDPFAIVDSFLCALLYPHPPSTDNNDWQPWELIKKLFSYLTEQQKQNVVSSVFAIQDRSIRAYVLTLFAPQWNGELRRRAVQTALDDVLSTDERWRSIITLEALIEIAPVDLRETIIDAALDIASDTPTDFIRFNCLLNLSANFDAEAQNALLAAIFDPVSTIYDDEDGYGSFRRGLDLGYFARILTDKQARFIIKYVENGLDAVIEPYILLSIALPRLTPFDAPLAEEAIVKLPHAVMRAHAMTPILASLVETSPHLIHQIAQELMEEAPNRQTLWHLSDFAPFLPEEARQNATQFLLDNINIIPNDVSRSFYARLAPLLNHTQQQLMINRLEALDDPSLRIRLININLPFLPSFERAHYLQLIAKLDAQNRLRLVKDWFNMSSEDENILPLFHSALAEVFYEMRGHRFSDYLEVLLWFGSTLLQDHNFLVPRFFPTEVLQGLADCLLMLIEAD